MNRIITISRQFGSGGRTIGKFGIEKCVDIIVDLYQERNLH